MEKLVSKWYYNISERTMPAPEVERIPDWIKITFMSVAALEFIRIELKLRKIKKMMDEESTTQDGEPVPPDLNTATQKQIEKYRKQILEAATTPPSSHNK